MSRFEIHPDSLKPLVNQESEIADQLARINSELRSVMNHLHLDKNVESSIMQSLEVVSNKGVSNVKKLRAYADALNRIIYNYVSTENKLTGRDDSDWHFPDWVKKIADVIRKAGKMLGIDLAAIYSGDPVNLSTGNYVFEKSFLDFETIIPVSLNLYYNIQNEAIGVLGKGWNHNFELYLERSDNSISVHMADGSIRQFSWEDGKAEPFPGTFGTLNFREDSYVYTDMNFVSWVYDGISAKLVSVFNEDGVTVNLSYSDRQLLESVKSDEGVSLIYEYSEEGYLTRVTDYTGRTVKLEYSDGNLISVEDPNHNILRFEYDSNGHMSGMIDQNGNHALCNEYDSELRTISQKFADGGEINYRYDDNEKVVSMERQNHSVVDYYHDDLYRNTKIVYPDGEETFGYNSANLRTRYTDKRGNTTLYRYNKNGDLTELTNALGNVFTFEYNVQDLVSKILFNGEVIQTAEYDSHRHQVRSENALGDKQEISYDDRGRIVAVIAEDNAQTTFKYDEAGNLSEINDPEDGLTIYKYDDLRRVIQSVDGLGRETAYEYDANDRIVKVVNPLGEERTYKYDACGNMTEFCDYNGAITMIRYNEINRPAEIVDAEGNVTKYEYDKSWNVISVTAPDGGITEYTYDTEGRTSSIKDPLGNIETASYDPNGNLTERVAADGGVWKIEYDELNRPISVIDPVGDERKATIDAYGNVTEVLYGDGSTEKWEYDICGRPISYTDRCGYIRSYSYTPTDEIAEITDSTGIIEKNEFYPGGRLKRQTGADGTGQSFFYDAVGNVISVESDTTGTWALEYDKVDRLTHISHGDLDEYYKYDSLGNIVSVIDGDGKEVKYEYSIAGSLVKVVDKNGNETGYKYDPCQRLIAILRPEDGKLSGAVEAKKCRIHRYERDLVGNVRKIIEPDNSETEYSFDACGRVISKLDADGNLSSIIYRKDGKEERIDYADGKSIICQYDALKRLVEYEDWLGVTRVTQDNEGRVTEVDNPDGKTVKYEYTERGLLSKVVYPDGKECSYDYNAKGQIISVFAPDLKADYSYFNNGLISERTVSNGSNTLFSYDRNGMIKNLVHKQNGRLIDSFSYEYDNNGRKRSIRHEQEGGVNELAEFAYTNLGELESVHVNKSLYESFKYDIFGNRTERSLRGRTTHYKYDIMDRLTEENDGENEKKYSYDKRGNLANITVNGSNYLNLKFDALDRLSEAFSGDKKASYRYNAIGHRVGAEFDLGDLKRKESYTYDINSPAEKLLSVSSEDHSVNMIWDGGLLGQSSSDGFRQFLNDERMSPFSIIQSNEEVERYSYDVFGKSEGGSSSLIGFTGYRHDPVTGFYHAGVREYDPDTGRFISRDPESGSQMSPETLNYYNYCACDPINFFDPNGAWGIKIALGICGAIKKVGSRLVGDVVNSVKNGKLSFSSWQDYTGSAVGGFTGGVVYATTWNKHLAGAAADGAETLTANGLKMLTGVEGYRAEDGYTFKTLMKDTALSAATGAVTGFSVEPSMKNIKIPGLNKGRGSFMAVTKQLITKAKKDLIGNISTKSLLKMATVFGPGMILDGLVGKAKDGLKKWVKGKAKDILQGVISKIIPDKYRSILKYISGRSVSAASPVVG